MVARLLVLALIAAGLAGCNVVVTDTPVLSVRTAPAGPALAEGLWVLQDPDCRYDPATPVTSWPECAAWFISRRGRLVFSGGNAPPSATPLQKPDGSPTGWTALPSYYLAAGDPDVLQVGSDAPPAYYYLGLEPNAVNGAGQLTRLSFWLVQCGPINSGGKHPGRTLRPFPGLRFARAGEDNCTTRSARAIFEAARRSRAMKTEQEARWLRPSDEGPP